MPNQIDPDFDFSRRRKSYDFGPYDDGNVWEFVHGEDYHVTGDTFLAHAKEWAKKHDVTLEHKIIPADNGPRGANEAGSTPERVVLRFGNKFKE